MTTSFLWLLGYVVAAPILVAGIRFPSPKPQLQEDWQPAAVAAHKTWTLSRLDVRDILSNNKSTGGRHHRHLATSFSMSNYNSSVNECILLFGAFCNGNLGDVIQPTAMENLLALAAPEQCFWYAHPFEEELDRGNHIGELFSDKISGDRSRLIHLTPEHAEEVNQFKALIIGGGGIFASKHPPLDAESFAEGLTLPIIVLGVGANRYRSKRYATLLEKSSFVSGRDAPSIDALSSVLRESKDPTTQADSVALVRDPVLSNKMFSDVEGKCWKQSEGENGQPLCFILPASNSQATVEMHRHLVSHVVRPGDVFVNVFPKHQKEILEQHDYPGEILQVLDPAEFTERLCSCRAIVSTRFHGVILGLHMGVPTLGASGTSHGNKVPEVLIDTMRLPEQYLLINEGLTRRAVDLEVNVVREMYARHGRRATIHARLAALHDDFKAQARHVLFNVVGVRERPRQGGGGFEPGENLGGREKHQENDAGASGVAELSPADLATKGSAAFGRLSNSGVPFAGGGDTATRVDADTAAAANAIGMGSKMAEEWQPSTEKAEEAAEEEQAAATARRSPIVAPVKDVTTAAAAAAAVSTTPKRPKKEEPLNAVAASFPPLEEVSGGSLLASALLDNNVLSARSTEEREEGGDPEPLPSSKTAYFGETGAGPAGISTEGDEYSNAGVYVSGGNLFKTRVAAEEHQKGRDGVPVGVASADGNRHRGAEAAERVAAVTRASASAAAGDIDPVLTGEGVSTNVEVESAVVNHEYVVAILLIAAIVALALLPSGGAARQPSCSSDTVKEARECGKKTNPHIHGDAESDSSGLSAVRSARPAGATPGAAATSSKMIFMLNFMVWVSLAMGFSGYGKAYLRETQDPIGLLVLQGGIGAVVLCLLGHFGVLDLHPGKDLTPAAAQQAGLAAFLHTIQALLTNFAVFVGGVAVTNALKALEPVAAAAFSYFLLGKPCSGPRMAALATIVVGIIVLTFRNNDRGGGSDDVFSSAAFAMSAVACNALRNVVIKQGRPIPPHQTLFACSAAATAVGVALMLLRHARLHLGDLLAESGRSGGDVASEGGDTGIAGHHDLTTSWLRMDGINAALCFVGYNLASFNLLARLSPVGHAVGNSCKRVLVFASGLLFLGEVMSVRQLGGAAVALFGVLAYNIAGTR